MGQRAQKTTLADPQALFDHLATHFISKGQEAGSAKVRTVATNRILTIDIQEAVDETTHRYHSASLVRLTDQDYLRLLVNELTNVAAVHDLHFDPEDLCGNR